MHGTKYKIATRIGNRTFLLRIGTPQHIDNTLLTLGDSPDHSIRETFPTTSCVRGGLMCTHRENSIEKQDTLLSPAIELARGGNGGTDIVVYLLQDVS